MCRHGRLPLWAPLIAIALFPCTAVAQHVYDVYDPPDPIADALRVIGGGRGNRGQSITSLAANDAAAPYIRHALALSKDGIEHRDLKEALRPIEARAYARLIKRFPNWLDSGRFDLCAAAFVLARTTDDADAMVAPLTKALNDIGVSPSSPVKPTGTFFGLPTHEIRKRQGRFFSGDEVVFGRGTRTDESVIRADRFAMGNNFPIGVLAVVRSKLTYPGDIAAEWFHSVVLVADDMPLRGTDQSLIICAGNITLEGWMPPARSFIIAGGDIRASADSENRGGDQNTWYAGGNIVLPNRKNHPSRQGSLFHARGSITFAEPAKPPEIVKPYQKSIPFPIRFLDPAEFGLDLVGAFRAGVAVRKVEGGSVFARHDVRAGDLITKVNGAPADSLNAFRRQLRRGVIDESLVLHIVREGKSITRIVYLDGVPVAEAPAPRPK